MVLTELLSSEHNHSGTIANQFQGGEKSDESETRIYHRSRRWEPVVAATLSYCSLNGEHNSFSFHAEIFFFFFFFFFVCLFLINQVTGHSLLFYFSSDFPIADLEKSA